MANETIYPFGAGALPAGIGVVNDLTTGGADRRYDNRLGDHLQEIGHNAGAPAI